MPEKQLGTVKNESIVFKSEIMESLIIDRQKMYKNASAMSPLAFIFKSFFISSLIIGFQFIAIAIKTKMQFVSICTFLLSTFLVHFQKWIVINNFLKILHWVIFM